MTPEKKEKVLEKAIKVLVLIEFGFIICKFLAQTFIMPDKLIDYFQVRTMLAPIYLYFTVSLVADLFVKDESDAVE